MILTIPNAQNDGGALCPHMIRILSTTGELLHELVCKPETGFTSFQKTISDGEYDIELINPNLFESRVVRRFFWWNGGDQVFFPDVNVFACDSIVLRVSNLPNLTLETFNYGTNVNNVLYSVDGDVERFGTDLDGNAIPSGYATFEDLNFVKILDSVPASIVLKNNKFRMTGTGLEDTSSYIPYLPPHQATQPTQQNVTPVIEKVDDQTILWKSPTFPSLVVRTVEIYKDGQPYRTDTLQGSGQLSIQNLVAGVFKIRYTVNSNSNSVSEFSNEITLYALTQTSATPTIVSHDSQTTNNCASVDLSGVVGATLFYQKNGGSNVTIGTITRTDGKIDNPFCLEAGTYTFSQIESGKNESAKTSSITITDPVVTQSCDFEGSFTVSSIAYNAGILQFVFNAEGLYEGSWKIKQGSTVKASGTLLPSNNNPQISVGTLSSGNYTFELTGVTCLGTAIGTFTVATTGGDCDLPTGSIQADKSSYSVGETATFTVTGLTNQTSVQWGKNGVLINQTGNTLTLSNLALSQNGDKYQLYIENNCGGGKTKSSVLSNEITLSVQATAPTTKRYFIPAKMDSVCASEVIQIGYSTTQVQPSVWVDADLTKMLVSTGGVTSEVTSGGVAYQAKSYDLPAGTYYFYARQKTATSNVVYIGSLVVTI